MLLDAEQRQDGWFKDTVFDVCICGAGPAGITLARALAAKGHRIALMEAGGLEVTNESQDIYRGENVGLPYLPLDACRLRYLGGSSNHWGGYTRPLDARDFEPMPGHPLNAWPIRKSDLDAYAGRTAEILDLPPAAPPYDIFAGKDDIIQAAVYRVSPIQFGAKYRDEITRSDRITLCLNANLIDIALEPGLRAAARMEFRSYSREEPFHVEARCFVVCCGGLENPRVLLNANRQIAAGIGNQHDQVGRYFCEHIEIGVGRALLASPLSDDAIYVASDRIIEERRCLSFSLTLLPLENSVSSYAQPLDERIAEALHKPREVYFDASVVAVACQAVNPESRVVPAESSDRFGLRHLALDWHIAHIDGLTLRTAAEEMGRALAHHEVGRLRLDPWVTDRTMSIPINKDQSGSSHHMCTTRMSDDPGKGVVDRDCRVHGIENLYIGGSSVFASAGISNPTFTIVQLALRLADHLDARLHKS
jgi:choline dehydrogenase-like flavoprotein